MNLSILEALFTTGYSGFVSGEFRPNPEAEISAKRAIEDLRGLNIEGLNHESKGSFFTRAKGFAGGRNGGAQTQIQSGFGESGCQWSLRF